ncbi:hypothetical protein LZP73_06235 [Shewanella sp. AS16]|uniref:hypothetical protein n=1 Tax=Shewanella sp. AS16 TaxID=2907625 RepID=UPI001F4781C5|nr:hypothetical protein [Shewanella sp. AS16]MCE9685815.1 hypothetical protein [Shewanella sp. AS16]
MNNAKWTRVHTTLVLLLIGALIYIATNLEVYFSLIGIWSALTACIVVFIVILGHGITGSWRGAFIDDRNVISLSRFQMLAWTALVLSAFLAAALWNIGLNVQDPIDSIQLEPSLWMLMGISTTSLVASPLILSGKKSQQPDASQVNEVFELLENKGEGAATNRGLVVGNKYISQARWGDMFTGEETGNAAHLDLARVQMFFFTIVVLLAYAVAVATMFANVDVIDIPVTAFPKLSQGLLALIGISHVGYLANKAAPLSATSQNGGNASNAPSAADAERPAVG